MVMVIVLAVLGVVLLLPAVVLLLPAIGWQFTVGTPAHAAMYLLAAAVVGILCLLVAAWLLVAKAARGGSG